MNLKYKTEQLLNKTVRKRDMLIIQIELAGKCSANCEFCDWTIRRPEQKVFMKTEWAKKAVKEAKEMGATHISFHITGESLDHPDFFDIVPNDCTIGLSTNCLSLEGETAERLARMENMNIILAVLWAEDTKKLEKSLLNAVNFLEMNPRCNSLSVQMICSQRAAVYDRVMYVGFKPYLDKIPQMTLMYKQPYTQEERNPVKGFIPRVDSSARILVDCMATPQSCGPDCLAIPPNPMNSILVQSDGYIKPCFYRPEEHNVRNPRYRDGWNMGHISTMTLQEFWDSDARKEFLKVWHTGDPGNTLPCHGCIRMATPDGGAWWSRGDPVPTELDAAQKVKGGECTPYPKPK